MSEEKKQLTYADAGVDIDAGNKAVELMKDSVRATYRPEVIGDLGGFGGLFALNIAKYKEPILVSGTDGVGTKLKLAFMADKHNTIGQDAVAMCVNDILVQGAEPLFFLDYIAVDKVDSQKVANIVKGVADACKESGCALIGGETAEMAGFYSKGEYDIAGFCVGVVDKSKMITGEKVKPGDVLLGLPSSGVHSNGFSLVRKVFDIENKPLDRFADELGGKTLGIIGFGRIGQSLGRKEPKIAHMYGKMAQRCAMLAGLLMTRVFKPWKLPAVTAYLVAGLLLGPFFLGRLGIPGLGFNSLHQVESLSVVTQTALGFIAFSIGNEFRLGQLKKTGRQATVIGIVQAVGVGKMGVGTAQFLGSFVHQHRKLEVCSLAYRGRLCYRRVTVYRRGRCVRVCYDRFTVSVCVACERSVHAEEVLSSRERPCVRERGIRPTGNVYGTWVVVHLIVSGMPMVLPRIQRRCPDCTSTIHQRSGCSR